MVSPISTPHRSRPRSAPALQARSRPCPALPTSWMTCRSERPAQARLGAHAWFTLHTQTHSGGRDTWKHVDGRTRTPPPPPFPRASSSAISDDLNMESPTMNSSISSSFPTRSSSTGPFAGLASAGSVMSRSSTPQPLMQPSAAEMSRKVHGKRRRDDDLDASSFKRRAVSPGVSLQNSPTLSQSPVHKDPAFWGPHRHSRDGSTTASPGNTTLDRTSHAGSVSSPSVTGGGSKRIGFQGMNDTNDGLMKMSIE